MFWCGTDLSFAVLLQRYTWMQLVWTWPLAWWNPTSSLTQTSANQLVILLVEKFKGTMRKLELLMPLSFHMPVIICCLGTAQAALTSDSTAGQTCRTLKKLWAAWKWGRGEGIRCHIHECDLWCWEVGWNRGAQHRYVEEVTVQSAKGAWAICGGEWQYNLFRIKFQAFPCTD